MRENLFLKSKLPQGERNPREAVVEKARPALMRGKVLSLEKDLCSGDRQPNGPEQTSPTENYQKLDGSELEAGGTINSGVTHPSFTVLQIENSEVPRVSKMPSKAAFFHLCD